MATNLNTAETVAQDNSQGGTATLEPVVAPVVKPAKSKKGEVKEPTAQATAVVVESTQIGTMPTQVTGGPIEYTREDLMQARRYVLLVKRTARQAGFGSQSGKALRDTVGYKFDNMDVKQVLVEMGKEGFLDKYRENLAKWHEGLNKSAKEDTLKKNKALFEAALGLASDLPAYQSLIRSLQILCDRNQSWNERGNNLEIVYNGHRAMLDLFGINVTNSRRLRLTAA